MLFIKPQVWVKTELRNICNFLRYSDLYNFGVFCSFAGNWQKMCFKILFSLSYAYHATWQGLGYTHVLDLSPLLWKLLRSRTYNFYN